MWAWWRRQGGRRQVGLGMSTAGALLVVFALVIFIPPLMGVAQRSNNDHKFLKAWKNPGSALTSRLPASANTQPAGASCGAGSPTTEYALVDFPQLPGIEGVAGNGNWSMLLQRSVVHYAASAAPGGVGNSVIALHREPNFEPLNTLKIGDQIVVTSRSCEKYTYTITQMWTENPSQVTQLQPISSGSWLTVITCTPLWIDTQRIVIRAELNS